MLLSKNNMQINILSIVYLASLLIKIKSLAVVLTVPNMALEYSVFPWLYIDWK